MARLFVNVDVDDLERATRFYTEAFGLKTGRRFGPHAVELVGAEAHIYLLTKKAGSPPFDGATGTRSYERHWTPVHLDFVIDALELAVARAEAAGARSEGPIRDNKWGRMALMADPFG